MIEAAPWAMQHLPVVITKLFGSPQNTKDPERWMGLWMNGAGSWDRAKDREAWVSHSGR